MTFGKRLMMAVAVVLALGGAAVGVAKVKKPKTDPEDRTNNIRKQIVGGQARNVILFVGDGMDETAITAARNYWVGANGRLAMDRIRLSGSITTYAVDELRQRPEPFYVTDSAASGSAWATGKKTGLLRISTAPFTGEAVPTIAELAQKSGYRTGNVTTDSVTGATPAVQMAHVRNRSCEKPGDDVCDEDAKANGGRGSIAEQAADSKMDLIFGGGLNDFEQTIEAGPDAGKTVLDSARRQGFDIVTDADGLASYDGSKRLLGLFNGSGMTPDWAGQRATSTAPRSQRCETGKRPAEQPSLSVMTSRAIQILNRRSKGKRKGFFLQVEGADPDKGSHRADPCWMIGGVLALDNAVQVGLDFAKKNPKTLVIVTADHGQSAQIIPGWGGDKTALLTTNEGSLLYLGYATSPKEDGDQEHAGIPVPLRARGPQAANLMGLNNQTDIFKVVLRALKINAPK